MKKYFYIMTLLVCFPAMSAAAGILDGFFRDSDAFTVAKAVKLGREGNSSFNGKSILGNNGSSSGVEEGQDCDANCSSSSCNRTTGQCSKCSSGRYLYNNMCLTCPGNATCNGTDFACNSRYRKGDRQCVSNCTNVSCKSGATATETTTGCCCELTSCPSGQRLSGSSCVSNCSGVSCKSGYMAVSTSTGCCCEAAKHTCASGKVYNTTINKCVDAVCPMGCLDSCINGCGSCESGRYLSYTTGYCPTCSSAIANCKTCTGSSLGAKCTSCESGYSLTDGACKSECDAGQLKIGGQCVQCYNGVNGCPGATHRLSNGTCCNLPAGCSGFTNFDMSCTGCINGYTLSNGRCVKQVNIKPGLTCTEVPGRGCCTPAQMANPAMMCFRKNEVEAP